jgi:hypothetical protein
MPDEPDAWFHMPRHYSGLGNRARTIGKVPTAEKDVEKFISWVQKVAARGGGTLP